MGKEEGKEVFRLALWRAIVLFKFGTTNSISHPMSQSDAEYMHHGSQRTTTISHFDFRITSASQSYSIGYTMVKKPPQDPPDSPLFFYLPDDANGEFC